MRVSRTSSTIAALIAIPVVLAGCSSSEPAESSTAGAADGSTFVVETAYGDVTVPVDPERVAAVTYDSPWQLMSLDVPAVATIDYSSWLEGYTAEQQEYLAAAAKIGTYGEINFESLTATNPDLIIGDAYEVDEATFKRLSEIAPTVIVGGGVRGDWQSITEDISVALGRHDLWEAAKTEYEARRDEVKAEYADIIEGNDWINFSFGNETGEFSVQLPTGATGNLIVNEMGLEYGDAVPLDDEGGYGYASFSPERLDEVFDGVTVALTFATTDGSVHPMIQEIIDTDLFQTLDVAKNDHIYALSTSITDYRSATVWIDELVEKVLEPLSR